MKDAEVKELVAELRKSAHDLRTLAQLGTANRMYRAADALERLSAERVPMTEEQVVKAYCARDADFRPWKVYLQGIRAAEAFQGVATVQDPANAKDE